MSAFRLMMLLRCGRCLFGDGADAYGDRLIAACSDQKLGMAEFFLIAADLLWRERAEILLTQSADKEGAENAAVAALDTSVEAKPL